MRYIHHRSRIILVLATFVGVLSGMLEIQKNISCDTTAIAGVTTVSDSVSIHIESF